MYYTLSQSTNVLTDVCSVKVKVWILDIALLTWEDS